MAELDDVRAYLLTSSPLTALIADRIHPIRLPSDTNAAFPAMTMTTVSAQRFETWGGPISPVRMLFQLDCYALTYQEASDVANKLRLHLHAYIGPAGTGEIQGASFVTEADLYEARPNTEPLYRRMTRYRLNMTETVT